jgi:putative acetyltransferase
MIPSDVAGSSETVVRSRIDLRPIERGEASRAREVLDLGLRELWGQSYEEISRNHDPLADLEDPSAYYSERGGVFLVLVHDGRCIGTGGILGLDETTAELRRLWILEAYRGLGLGRRLAEALLVYARARGWRQVRLEIGTPERQAAAMGLYARLGFRPIERYREGPCSLAMEKHL